MNKDKPKKIPHLMSRADFILIAIISLLASLVYLVYQSNLFSGAHNQTDDKFVVVQNNTGIIYSASLQEENEFVVENEKGKNKVVIKDGDVWVEWADCPNQICVDTGKIHQVGSKIACLPHELLIEVVDDPKNASTLH